MSSHSNRDLQAAWTMHGEDTFTFEAVERLKDEELAYVRATLLKERVTHWRAMLDALAV